MEVLVSIVITTKDEKENIENCLKSIKNQIYPQDKIEIIVVDNNSTDRTKEIARQYTAKVYNFGPERSAQRNFGVRNATGKYILYLDADMILSRVIIRESVEKCERDKIIALYIPERIIGKGFWIKVRNFERSFYNATVIDCVRFIHRDKFLEIGGFDNNLTGPEDWDFDRRIRELGKVGIIKNALYHNEGVFSLKRYAQKKAYYSKNFNKYIQKWKKNDKITRKQFGFWYRYFGVFTENGKWLRLVRHFWLTLGLYYLRFLVGLSYLARKLRHQ